VELVENQGPRNCREFFESKKPEISTTTYGFLVPDTPEYHWLYRQYNMEMYRQYNMETENDLLALRFERGIIHLTPILWHGDPATRRRKYHWFVFRDHGVDLGDDFAIIAYDEEDFTTYYNERTRETITLYSKRFNVVRIATDNHLDDVEFALSEYLRQGNLRSRADDQFVRDVEVQYQQFREEAQESIAEALERRRYHWQLDNPGKPIPPWLY